MESLDRSRQRNDEGKTEKRRMICIGITRAEKRREFSQC